MDSLSSLSVYQYGRESLISLIHLKTDCIRAEISSKSQFIYLTSYLASNHINARTMVVEDEYTDRHYLEDYAAFYARCFKDRPRYCTRVHFFSHTFIEEKFLSNLVENSEDFNDQLRLNYIGYLIIKPLPSAFMGGIYVKAYKHLESSTNHHVIRNSHSVSLSGIELTLQTVGFTEQDEVVSACATSAIWSYFSAYGTLHATNLPSPSAITQSATSFNHEGARIFPSEGLTDTQVLRSLKHFEYEPLNLPVSTGDNNYYHELLKEYIFAYCKNNIPILIAGDVYIERGEFFEAGEPHLVCALGFHQNPSHKQHSKVLQLTSSRIDKFYIHDDRVGPFVRWEDNINFKLESGDKKVSASGLRYVRRENDDLNTTVNEYKEYFIPREIYIGLYHKIRVPYLTVKKISLGLWLHTQACLGVLKSSLKKFEVSSQPGIKSSIKIMKNFLELEHSIFLTTNTKLKKEVLAQKHNLFSFNGMEFSIGKQEFLNSNMPKYIWICRVCIQKNEELFPYLDMLLDATEIPQGNLLIGYLAYEPAALSLWKDLTKHAQNYYYGEHNDSGDFMDQIYKIVEVQQFTKLLKVPENDTHLNSSYGPARLPQRELKNGEVNSSQNIPLRSDIKIVKVGSSIDLESFDKSHKYIWVISFDGDFVYGLDIETDGTSKKSYQGHPTLIGNKPARIGGELIYASTNWSINMHSGNYSKHIFKPDDRKIFLQNVIKNFSFPEINIDSAYEKPPYSQLLK